MITPYEPMMCKALSVSDLGKFAFDANATNSPEYRAELKIDGWRAIVYKDGSDVAVLSRTGKDRAGHVPHIVETFQSHTIPDGVYDGEIVFVEDAPHVLDNVPVMRFNATARIMGSSEAVALRKQQHNAGIGRLQFVVFDVLEIDDNTLIGKTFKERSQILYDAIQPQFLTYEKRNILHVPSWTNFNLAETYNSVVAYGLEGLVLKNVDGLYIPGKRPSRNQYKIKAEKTFDVVVTGYTWAKEGKFEGLIGALKFSAYDLETDSYVEVGQTSGMSDSVRIQWTKYFNEPKSKDLDIHGVIQIRGNGLTDKPLGRFNPPRHPQYMFKRLDKLPQDCSIAQFYKI